MNMSNRHITIHGISSIEPSNMITINNMGADDINFQMNSRGLTINPNGMIHALYLSGVWVILSEDEWSIIQIMDS